MSTGMILVVIGEVRQMNADPVIVTPAVMFTVIVREAMFMALTITLVEDVQEAVVIPTGTTTPVEIQN